MKKIIKTVLLALGILSTTGILASAVVGPTVSGQGGDTVYSGHIEGERTSSGCYAATKAYRESGYNAVKAYVEIVNYQGYVIGAGSVGTGSDYAYSGTISRSGGNNAYGSVGTSNGSSSVFTRLY